MISSQKNSHHLVIHSSINYLEDVRNFLSEIFKEDNICNSKFNRLFLCISEGVSNAIVHGNNNIPEKDVKISIELTDTENVNVTIEDEGEGFNFSSIPDPVVYENLRKEEGRGLYIIKSYAEKVEFLNGGSVLKIKFNLGENDTVSF